MELTKTKDIYILECPYEARQIPTTLGFTWWSLVKDKWATTNRIIASRAFIWADEETKKDLLPFVRRQQDNVKASMALSVGSGEISPGIVVPNGLRLTPFQEASVSHIIKQLTEALAISQ